MNHKPTTTKLLFIGVRTFIYVIKERIIFVIYTIHISRMKRFQATFNPIQRLTTHI